MPKASPRPSLAVVVRCDGISGYSKLKASVSDHLKLDVFLSSYTATGDNSMHVYPGGKWEGIYDFFRCHADILDSHDYIWLPDDDIEVTPQAIETLVSAMSEHDLWLAQPALAASSQMYWPITLRCAEFRMRYTTFVELMAPCFRTGFLRSVLPLFKDRRTGYGLDQYWAYWTDKPARRCAIIDSAIMTHPRRKQASGLYRTPGDAYAERAEQQKHYGPALPPHLVTGAVALDGSDAAYDPALLRQVFRSGLRQLIKSESLVAIGRFLRLLGELWSNTKLHDLQSLRPLPVPPAQDRTS